jgi:hypothetical protein
LQKNRPTGQFSKVDAGSKKRIGARQVSKQPAFGILGLSAQYWLSFLGHTSGQPAIHAASITGYSCGEGCA